MRTPLGPGTAGTGTGSDAAAVEHHGHVVRSLGLTALRGEHRGAQVEAWGGRGGDGTHTGDDTQPTGI